MGVVLLKATVNSVVKNWKMFKLLFTALTVDRALRVDVLYYLMSTPTYLIALRNSISNSSNFSTTLYVIMFVGLIFPQRQFTNGQQFVAKLWLNQNNNDVPSYYYENFPFDCFQGSLSVFDYFEAVRSMKWIESFDNLYEIKFLSVSDEYSNELNPRNKRIFIQLESDSILIWIFENSASSFTLRRHSHIKFLEPLEIEMKVINQLDVIENKSFCKIIGKFQTDMEITKLERLFLTENEKNVEILKKNSTFQINIALKEDEMLESFLKVFQIFESRDINENGNSIYNPAKENFYEDCYVYTLNDPIELDNPDYLTVKSAAEDSTNETSFIQESTNNSEIPEKLTANKEPAKSAVELDLNEPEVAALITPSRQNDISSSVDVNSSKSSNSPSVEVSSNISNSKLIADSGLAKKLNKFQSFVREKFKESKLQNKTAQSGIWEIEPTQIGKNQDWAKKKVSEISLNSSDGRNRSENNILSKLRMVADRGATNSLSNGITYSKNKEVSSITANDTSMSRISNENTSLSEVSNNFIEKSMKLRNTENAINSKLLEELSSESIAQRVSRKKVVYRKQETSIKRRLEKETYGNQSRENTPETSDFKKRRKQKLTDSSDISSSLPPEDSPIVKRLRAREKPKEQNSVRPAPKTINGLSSSKKKSYPAEKRALSKPKVYSRISRTKEETRVSSNDSESPINGDKTISRSLQKGTGSSSEFDNTAINKLIMSPLNIQNQVFQNLNRLSTSLVRRISIMNEEMQRKADEITKEMQSQIEAVRKEHENKLEKFHTFIENMSNVAFKENDSLEEWISQNK